MCWDQCSESWETSSELAQCRLFQNNLGGLFHSRIFSHSSQAFCFPNYTSQTDKIERVVLGRRKYEYEWGRALGHLWGRTVKDELLEVQSTLLNIWKTNQACGGDDWHVAPEPAFQAAPRACSTTWSLIQPRCAQPRPLSFPLPAHGLPTAKEAVQSWLCMQNSKAGQEPEERGLQALSHCKSSFYGKNKFVVIEWDGLAGLMPLLPARVGPRETEAVANNIRAIVMHCVGPLCQPDPYNRAGQALLWALNHEVRVHQKGQPICPITQLETHWLRIQTQASLGPVALILWPLVLSRGISIPGPMEL